MAASSRTFYLVLAVGGLLVLLAAGMISRHWDAFALEYARLADAGEGKALADALQTPEDLLQYALENPRGIAVASYRLGNERGGAFIAADASQGVAGIDRLLLMAAWALASDSLRESRVPRSWIDAAALPDGQGAQHEEAMAWLDGQGGGEWMAVSDLAHAATRWDAPVLGEVLARSLGDAAVATVATRLGLPALEEPMPWSGQQVLWSSEDGPGGQNRLAQLDTLDRPAVRAQVREQAARLRGDATFAELERRRRSERGDGLSARQRRRLARATAPRGTAAAYARLLAGVALDTLGGGRAAARLHAVLDAAAFAPDTLTSAGTSSIALLAGRRPGMSAVVGVADHPNPDSVRVTVLLFDDLTVAVDARLRESELDRDLALRLLTDGAFRKQARRVLREAELAAGRR